jgi:hypothetical protein
MFLIALVATACGSITAPSAMAAPTLVQHISKDAGTSLSSSLAFPLNNTAGNWIGVVIRAGHSGQVFTVSDTRGNTYRQAVLFNQTLDTPNGDTFAIIYAENIAGGSNTVTVSESISNNTLRFAILEYSGVATANSLDVTAAAQGTGTSASSGSATTAAGGGLVLGVVMTGGGSTYTAGSGYAIEERVPAAPNTKLIAEDEIQVSAGVVSANGTLAQLATWGAALAAFKAAVGGGGTSPNITALSPASGAVTTPVTITGANFGATQGSSTVMFNGTTAAPANIWSATSINVLVPAIAAGNATVVVTVGGVASNGVQFTVTPISVNLAPPTATLATNTSTGFTATVQNDVLSKGVSWSLAGGGCSGSTCGTLVSPSSPYTIGYVAPSSAPNPPTLTLTATSIADPTKVGSATITVTQANPIIASLNPTSGGVFSLVTISGTNFGAMQGTSMVTFSGAQAGVSSWSDTSIVAIVPGAAITGNVLVTVGGIPSNGMAFTVTPSNPTIAGVSPSSGTIGTSVTITGTGFSSVQGTSTVTFNGTSATPTSWSPTSIAVFVPSGATTGNVVVTVGGVASSGVLFSVPPVISSLSNTFGPVGTSVTISGSGFGATQGSSTVTFNGTAAAPASSWSPASISVLVPAIATGNATVVVTVGGLASNGGSFTVTAPAMGIALVQHVNRDAGTALSSSLTFPLNNTAGNWIGVVIRAGHSGQVFTVSDTRGNTYRQAVLFNQTLDTPNGDTFAIIYAENIAGGSNTVTVSESISNNTLRFAILEYSGVATANSLDVTAAAQGTGTSASSGSATTAAGGGLVLGVVMTGGGSTYTAGSGYAIEERVPAAPNTKLIAEDEIQVSAGVVSANGTLAQLATWGAALAAFNPIGGSGTGPNISNLSAASGAIGTPVTITGTNFGTSQGTSTVTFSGTGAGPASSWSATSISVLVPAAAATGNVVVTVGGVPSNGINFTVQNSLTVAVAPKRAAIHILQTQQFTATVTNDLQNAGVSWTVDGILNGNSSVGLITASGLLTPGTQLGPHTVTATSITNSAISTSVSIAVTDLPGVFTYHNDNSRTGQNPSEYALTPSLVTTTTFGKLFSCPVDGAVYAQPLWVPNLTINAGKHNVLFVATAHDSLYAFDADANPCMTLWHVNLIDADHGGTSGETTVPSGRTGFLVGLGAGDISPEVGVIGSPVIDPNSGTLYVVGKSFIPASSPLVFFQRLHAIDANTGSEKITPPVSITSAIWVSGTGEGSTGGQLPFDVRNQNQRAGLALANGNVYICWGSHEDKDPWHGWSMSFNAPTLAFIAAYSSTPNSKQGGIWMGGGAPAVDASNNLYMLTGNGNWDGMTEFGDSFLKLTSNLSVADWFTPSDQSTLNSSDLDLGSGGAVILLDLPSAPVRHLVLGGGKQGSGATGEIFVLNRDSMGHNNSTDSQVVQKFPAGGELFSTGAFWQNTLFIAGVGGPLKAFSFNPVLGSFNTSSVPQSSNTFGFPGATPAVSSSGATNGIVWAIDNSLYCTPQSPGCGPAVLHAYDAANVHNELWNSSQAGGNRDRAGNPVKFTVPTVANGKVYIGTQTELDIYGLLTN